MLACVLSALGAAVLFAVTSVIQHQRSLLQPAENNMSARLVLNLFRDGAWWVSIGTSAAGYVLQTIALHLGGLQVVQPILVLALVMAVPSSVLLVEKRRLSSKDLVGAALTAGAVGLFLVASHPSGGRDYSDAARWAVALSGPAALVAAMALLSLRVSGFMRALLQATGAGVANGTVAVLLKGLTGVARTAWQESHSVGAVIVHACTSWMIVPLLIGYLVLLVLIQSAFNVGPISWSLPALTVANPVASILLGVYAFGERVSVTALAMSSYPALVLCCCVGVWLLSRSPAAAGR